MRISKLVALGAAAGALACSSGSDRTGPDVQYTGSTAVVAVTDANAEALAAATSADAAGVTTNPGGGVLAALRTRQPAFRQAMALAALHRQAQGVAATGVVQSGSGSCQVGGSISATMNDIDQDGNLNLTGEWGQVTFKNCNDDGTTIMNGTLKIEILAADGADPTGSAGTLTSGFNYEVRETVSDFSIATIADGSWFGIEGDIDMHVVWNNGTFQLASTVSGSGIAQESFDGHAVTSSALITSVPGTSGYSMTSIEEYSDVYASTVVADQQGMSARLCSISLAGCVDVVMSPNYRTLYVDQYPSSGTLRLTGLSGHYVQVTALDGVTGAITIVWDAGNGAKTCANQMTWATLGTGVCQVVAAN